MSKINSLVNENPSTAQKILETAESILFPAPHLAKKIASSPVAEEIKEAAQTLFENASNCVLPFLVKDMPPKLQSVFRLERLNSEIRDAGDRKLESFTIHPKVEV